MERNGSVLKPNMPKIIIIIAKIFKWKSFIKITPYFNIILSLYADHSISIFIIIFTSPFLSIQCAI